MRTLLILSIFLVVFSAFGQNIANETVAVMERWNQDFFHGDISRLYAAFSSEAYMRVNGNFYYGQTQLRNGFQNLFNSLSECNSGSFGALSYLNHTAHMT